MNLKNLRGLDKTQLLSKESIERVLFGKKETHEMRTETQSKVIKAPGIAQDMHGSKPGSRDGKQTA